MIFISDEISQDEYTSSPTITMTADMPYNVSCTALGARPPVLLEWQIPTDVHVLIRNQSNNMQGDSYVSRRVVTVIPTKNDHGKELTCWVPNHNGSLHTTTRLDVEGKFQGDKNTNSSGNGKFICICIYKHECMYIHIVYTVKGVSMVFPIYDTSHVVR